MAKLSIIPTPIGNLDDITLRAIKTINECDVLLCEDTRVTQKLLKHLEVDKKLIAYHQHNEHKGLEKFITLIEENEHVGLVSDAGTPAISDPGFLLVRACIERGIEVECLPGATAFVPALVVSGLPNTSFTFFGFLPQKKGRQTKIQEILANPYTSVIYESPHKLLKTLTQFNEFQPNRKISVSREISKMFEETIRGTVSEVLAHFSSNPIKGEFVICIEEGNK